MKMKTSVATAAAGFGTLVLYASIAYFMVIVQLTYTTIMLIVHVKYIGLLLNRGAMSAQSVPLIKPRAVLPRLKRVFVHESEYPIMFKIFER